MTIDGSSAWAELCYRMRPNIGAGCGVENSRSHTIVLVVVVLLILMIGACGVGEWRPSSPHAGGSL